VTASSRSRPRWPLHPLTAAAVLLAVGAFGAFSAAVARSDDGRGELAAAGAALLLAAVAGAAAGFANSGST
jgi:hypothetical protein